MFIIVFLLTSIPKIKYKILLSLSKRIQKCSIIIKNVEKSIRYIDIDMSSYHTYLR